MKRTMIAVAVGLLLSVVANANEMHDPRAHGMKHHGMMHHTWGMWLKKADANGDGKVTKEEFMAASKRYAEKKFAWLDANGDGVIDASDRKARQKKRFDRIDANHDGKITLEEWESFHAKMRMMHEKPMQGGM